MSILRQNKINEELKRALSVSIRSVKDPRIPEFISINAVEATPDLKYAKVYIGFFSDMNEKKKKDALAAFEKAKGYIKRETAKNIKLRAIPDFTFIVDESVSNALKIENILSEIELKERKKETDGNEADE